MTDSVRIMTRKGSKSRLNSLPIAHLQSQQHPPQWGRRGRKGRRGGEGGVKLWVHSWVRKVLAKQSTVRDDGQ